MKRLLAGVFFLFFFILFSKSAYAVEFNFPNGDEVTNGTLTVEVRDITFDTCYNVVVTHLDTTDDILGGPKAQGCPVVSPRVYATFRVPPNGTDLPVFNIPVSEEGRYQFAASGANGDSGTGLAEVVFVTPVPTATQEQEEGESESGETGLPIESYVVSPNPFDINGNTGQVRLSYRNLGAGPYKLCVLSHPNFGCGYKTATNGPTFDAEDVFAEIGDNDEISAGTLSAFNVCGDGPNRLKLSEDEGAGNCSTEDYFHEGFSYETRLYDTDNNQVNQPGATISFYTRFIFPQVFINDAVVTAELVALSYDREINVEPAPPSSGDLQGLVPISFPITVSVGGEEYDITGKSIGPVYKRAGGQNRNNYQIVLEGQDNGYKGETCEVVPGAETNSNPVQFTQDDRSLLQPGRYILKINDQENEANGVTAFLRKDECQGGFTFFHIPILVRYEEDVNEVRAYIEADEIIIDPNGNEVGRDNEYDAPQLVCAEGLDINGQKTNDPALIVTCLSLQTAIGPFSIDLYSFISDIFGWIVALASMVALAMLIYSGYQIIYSRGDREKIQTAKDNIKAVVIGFVFILMSIAILQFIGVDVLRIPGLG